MRAETRRLRRRSAALALGSLTVMGGVLGLTGGVAGATYLECSGDQVFDVPGNRGVELYDVFGYDVVNYELGWSLQPGTYTIEASSFDGYIGRKDVPVDQHEKSERWYAEFLDAGGTVVGALDRPTTDLPDETDVAEVVDRYEHVVITGTATTVRLILVKDFRSLNLVHVGCLGFKLEASTTEPVPPSTTVSAVLQDTRSATPTTATPTTALPTTTVQAVAVKAATLPVTGADASRLAVIGSAAVALGLNLVMRSRRAARPLAESVRSR